jgi:glycosyltransferase involved in cell wall biosynthesis
MALHTVVVVNDFAHVEGGAAQVALTTALGLAERGLRVVFVAAVGPVDPRLIQAGVDVHCLDQQSVLGDPHRLRAAVQGLWSREAAALVRDVLAGCDPHTTVIHLNSWTRALSASFVPVAVAAGIPIVCTLHDYFTACPNGAFFDFQAGTVCERVPMSASCVTRHCDARHFHHKLWRVARHAIQRHLGQIPSAIRTFVAVSPFSLERLQPFLPAGATIRLVPYPIDIEQQSPIRPAANRDVVMIGRLAPEKGPRLLAAAAKAAGVGVRFVGDGPEAAAIRALNPEAGLSDGWVDRAGVLQALEHARALVFPSVWYETQGLVVLEALARGVPVVVADGCAARDAVVPDETGFLFRSGDAADLARQLRRLDDDTVTRMGRAAYERYWAAPYATDLYLDRITGVFAEALGL